MKKSWEFLAANQLTSLFSVKPKTNLVLSGHVEQEQLGVYFCRFKGPMPHKRLQHFGVNPVKQNMHGKAMAKCFRGQRGYRKRYVVTPCVINSLV